ncbi:hypothetical protein E4U17_002813 [Claviceps sp. LM77 group G4]|nr:hypothetical protein E4U33_001325 [Claviceps sp. LM78 group G4]KAG6055671.1 hypothetical protein E4U17_002813 [Claviceps sp. LM77 group G4]KAG6077052.1 hypothetical protein E4U16_002458 [Claviceps sp. LM84 group G4]
MRAAPHVHAGAQDGSAPTGGDEVVHGTGTFGNIRTCWVTMAAHEHNNKNGCHAKERSNSHRPALLPQHRERHTVPTATMSTREPQIMELHSEVLRRLENHRAP